MLARATRRVDVALATLVAAGVVVGAVHGEFTDLTVYRDAGRAVLDGSPLEARDPGSGLRFTYPPFAAVLMTPLAVLPAPLVAALWTGASVGALGAAIVAVRRALGRPVSGWQVVVLTAAAFALEPVWQNVAFGQVNTLLMVAVLVDLLGPGRRFSGVLLGVAAGVKLTPLVFVVLLALVRRYDVAGRAALAFVGTVVLGWLARPGSSAAYWTSDVVDADRVGPPALAHNQSVYGVLTRLLDEPPGTLLWLVVAGPVALAVLAVAAGWWRRGDRVLGSSLAALATLLASPVSWSHHWVWAVPVALAIRERNRWVAVGWTLVFVARPILWPPWGSGREYDWSPVEQVVGNADVLAALAVTVWAAVALARVRRR